MLKHHANSLPHPIGIVFQRRPPVQQDVAAVGLVQSVQNPQQRRLAGARRADHRHRAAGWRVDINPAQHGVSAERQVNILARQRY
jgi:hypothetical protein